MVVEKIPHTVESKEIRFRGKPFEAHADVAFLAECLEGFWGHRSIFKGLKVMQR